MKLNVKTLTNVQFVINDVPVDITIAQLKELIMKQQPDIFSEDKHVKAVVFKGKQLVDDAVLSTEGIVDNDMIVIIVSKIKAPPPVAPTLPSVTPMINPAVSAPPSAVPAPPSGEQVINIPNIGNFNMDQLHTMMTMVLMQHPDSIREALMQDPGLVILSRIHPDIFNGLTTDVAFIKELVKSDILRVGDGFGHGGGGGGGGEEELYHEPAIVPDLTPVDHENIATLMTLTKIDKMTVTQLYIASDKNPDIAYAMLTENGTK
jgi:hypothetical protein